jgi:hypothetical protein
MEVRPLDVLFSTEAIRLPSSYVRDRGIEGRPEAFVAVLVVGGGASAGSASASGKRKTSSAGRPDRAPSGSSSRCATGPLAHVKRLALGPSPQMLLERTAAVVSLGREHFANLLVLRGRQQPLEQEEKNDDRVPPPPQTLRENPWEA